MLTDAGHLDLARAADVSFGTATGEVGSEAAVRAHPSVHAWLMTCAVLQV